MNKNSKLHRAIFWALSLTWGLPITIIGMIVFAGLCVFGHKPKRFGFCFYIPIGECWGGLEFGPIFLVDKYEDYSVMCHEHGHGFQNIILGPLFPVLVSLRSGARYWLREIRSYTGKVIFTTILSIVLFVVSTPILVAGCMQPNVSLIVIGAILVIYAVFFTVWLSRETCRHKNTYPDYDNFWVEGNATRVGEKFMSK